MRKPMLEMFGKPMAQSVRDMWLGLKVSAMEFFTGVFNPWYTNERSEGGIDAAHTDDA